MFARRSRLALAFLLALPAAAFAQGFEYSTGTSQYKVTSKTKGAQEMMGQRQDFETSSDQVMTVILAKGMKDTLGLQILIDSMSAIGPMGMAPPGLDKIIGSKITAKVSPFGLFYSVEPPKDTTNAALAQINEEVGRFLPRIRQKPATGASWTDTTGGKSKMNGLDIERKIVTKFTVVGDTVVGAEKGWKIGTETNTTMSGSGAPQGQPMTIEGTVVGKGTVVLSQKGVYLGRVANDSSNMKVTLAASGMEVGIISTASTTVKKVK